MPDHSELLLRAILSMTARQAIPPPELMQMVAPRGTGSEAQLAAYNLCDGTKAQGEIARELKIDPGNFSRTAARWMEAGIVLRLGDNRDAKLLHVYPLPKERAREGR